MSLESIIRNSICLDIHCSTFPGLLWNPLTAGICKKSWERFKVMTLKLNFKYYFEWSSELSASWWPWPCESNAFSFYNRFVCVTSVNTLLTALAFSFKAVVCFHVRCGTVVLLTLTLGRPTVSYLSAHTATLSIHSLLLVKSHSFNSYSYNNTFTQELLSFPSLAFILDLLTGAVHAKRRQQK